MGIKPATDSRVIHNSFTSLLCMMAESYEDKFKAELYKRYNHCKEVLIPKDVYFTMIEELKAASVPGGKEIEVTITSFPSKFNLLHTLLHTLVHNN